MYIISIHVYYIYINILYIYIYICFLYLYVMFHVYRSTCLLFVKSSHVRFILCLYLSLSVRTVFFCFYSFADWLGLSTCAYWWLDSRRGAMPNCPAGGIPVRYSNIPNQGLPNLIPKYPVSPASRAREASVMAAEAAVTTERI